MLPAQLLLEPSENPFVIRYFVRGRHLSRTVPLSMVQDLCPPVSWRGGENSLSWRTAGLGSSGRPRSELRVCQGRLALFQLRSFCPAMLSCRTTAVPDLVEFRFGSGFYIRPVVLRRGLVQRRSCFPCDAHFIVRHPGVPGTDQR